MLVSSLVIKSEVLQSSQLVWYLILTGGGEGDDVLFEICEGRSAQNVWSDVWLVVSGGMISVFIVVDGMGST